MFSNSPDSQSTPCLKLTDEPVPRVLCVINHLINRFLVQDGPGHLPWHPEGLGEKGSIAGVLHIMVTLVDDEVEECLQLYIA